MTDPSSADRDTPPARPQYGEYASAEEQRARIRQPDASWALETGQAPGVTPVTPAREAAAPARPGGSVADRIVTMVLLALGFVHVATTAPGLFQLDRQFELVFELMGVDATVTDVAGMRMWGAIAAVSLVVGWLVTAFLAWRRLRRGRLAFWMPLVGLVGTMIVALVCLNIAISNDPAFLDIVDQLGSTAP